MKQYFTPINFKPNNNSTCSILDAMGQQRLFRQEKYFILYVSSVKNNKRCMLPVGNINPTSQCYS